MPRLARRYIFSELTVLLFSLCVLLGASAEAAGTSLASLRSRNAALKAELALASTGGLYLVIDLPEGSAEVKSRALTLKSFAIERAGFSGRPSESETLVLRERRAGRPPQRNLIDPSAKREMKPARDGALQSAYEIQALELDDMPSDFEFHLTRKESAESNSEGGDLIIGVHAEQGRMQRIRGAGKALWHALRKRFGGKAVRRLDLQMTQEEARALYWVAAENTMVLLIPEQTDSRVEPPAPVAADNKKKALPAR